MNRGDIWHVDLDPTKGREQEGARFVLIISPKEFNHQFGTPLCVPITLGGSLARHAGFAATLTGTGTKTHGIVLCNQVRILDLAARNAKFIEREPLAKLSGRSSRAACW